VPEVGAGSGKARVNIPTLVFVFLLFVSLALPFRANASVFSFLIGLFSPVQANANTEILPNSQNMALLQAAISPASLSTTTDSTIQIVGNTSLSPETQGPLTDGKDHSADSDQISVYVVQTGDTLPAIAQMFGVTTNTIVWANNLKGGKISVGEQLVILPISGVKYTVKSGDTLIGIAKKFNGNMDDILSYNNLSADSKISVGDTVFIPDGEMTTNSSGQNVTNGGSQSAGNLGSGTTGSYNSFTPETGSSTIMSGSGSIPVGAYCQNYPSVVGYYMRPVATCIKTQGIHGHNAVDLAAQNHQIGEAVMAAADGQVIVSRNSGWNGGYGSYIVIKHGNGTETLYAHLSQTDVSVGDEVEQGQVIGAMGSTGDSTGPHLHFEIRGAINPF
jgi:murein DD-endopeptidase MepM/ murein hydrolase activator NlpD